MRVAFTMFGDASWTGGLNYLRNLFSALADLPDRPVDPVLFVGPGTPADACRSLQPYLSGPPVVVDAWKGSRASRLAGTLLTQSDAASLAAFRAHGIDLVFFNDAWYGMRFPLPTLAWIADFQHCHLKSMFTPVQRFKRWAKFSVYCSSASRVMVSSEDGRRDCEQFFPSARGKVDAVPFAVQLDDSFLVGDPRAVAAQYGLPQKFLYFPGQLWRHKNHLALIEALQRLKAAGHDVVIAASGNAKDGRHPDHPQQVFDLVESSGLKPNFRFLGLIPYEHIMPLMRASAAVLNPSLFEGWSTTVEEAKAVGVPLVLSDLRVHREQAPDGSIFFDPHSPASMADGILRAWQTLQPGPRVQAERDAIARYRDKRIAFARRFVEVARSTLATSTQR